jgi:tetratricopeptide (TPR) repeat protein
MDIKKRSGEAKSGSTKKMTSEERLYQGRLHSVKGEYKEAIKEYKKVLKIDPNCKPAEINLAFISYMKGPLNKDRIASNKHMRLAKKK